MKHLKYFESDTEFLYGENVLTSYKGLTFDEILEHSCQFIEWRWKMTLSLTPRRQKDGVSIEYVNRVVVRDDGSIYIAYDSDGESYHHEVFDTKVYYEFIIDPDLYIETNKYNL